MKSWSIALPLAVLFIAGGLWWSRGSNPKTPAVEGTSVRLTLTREFNLGFEFTREGPISWAAAASQQADLLAAYDASSHQVRTYTLQGEPAAAFGSEGMQPGQFIHPSGLAVDGRGGILVADSEIPVIRRYARDGKLIDETPAVVGIKGWFDVAAGPDDEIVAAPDASAALLGKKGVYRFADGNSKSMCSTCFGPVTVDAQENVYLLDLGNVKESGDHFLTGMTPGGRVLFNKQHSDRLIKSDLLFWPEASCLVLVNAGARRVEAYRTDGTPLPALLTLPQEESPPVAAIPLGDSLLVVQHSGQVEVYQATFAGQGS